MQDPTDSYLIGRRWGWLLLGRYLSLLAAWIHHESKHPCCAYATNKRIIGCKRNRLGCFSHTEVCTMLHKQSSLVIHSGIWPNGREFQHIDPVLTPTCTSSSNPVLDGAVLRWLLSSHWCCFFTGCDCLASLKIQLVVLSRTSHLGRSFAYWNTEINSGGSWSKHLFLYRTTFILTSDSRDGGSCVKMHHHVRNPISHYVGKAPHWENRLMVSKTPQNTTNMTSAFSTSHAYCLQN